MSAFVGMVVLADPDKPLELARQCAALLGQEVEAPPQVDTTPRAAVFDELFAEITAYQNLPRPEMAPQPVMPHHVLALSRADSTPPAARANRRQSRSSGPLSPVQRIRQLRGQRRPALAPNPRSIFEQSRSYRRHGSALERRSGQRLHHRRWQ